MTNDYFSHLAWAKSLSLLAGLWHGLMQASDFQLWFLAVPQFSEQAQIGLMMEAANKSKHPPLTVDQKQRRAKRARLLKSLVYEMCDGVYYTGYEEVLKGNKTVEQVMMAIYQIAKSVDCRTRQGLDYPRLEPSSRSVARMPVYTS